MSRALRLLLVTAAVLVALGASHDRVAGVGFGARADALFLGGVFKGLKNIVSSGVKAVAGAVKAVGGVVIDAAKVVGGAVVAVAGEVVKVAGAVVKDIGKVVVAAGKLVVEGIKDLALLVAKLGGPIIDLVKKFVLDKLYGFAKGKLHDFFDLLAKAFGGNLKWLSALEKAATLATKVDVFLDKYVQQPLDILESVLGKRHYLDYARDPNQLVNEAKRKLVTWATDKAVDFAMSLVKGLANEVTKGLIELGMKILKQPITAALAGVLSGAVSAVTSGIGALLQPAIKWVIDQLLDRFAIPKLAEALVGLLLNKVEGFVRDKVSGLVGKLTDKVVDGIVSKYLQKWIDKWKAATGKIVDTIDRVADKLQGVVTKANQILATIHTATDAVRKLRDLYKTTCKTVLERCCALASSYNDQKRRWASPAGMDDVYQAMQAMILLRREYKSASCQYGERYCGSNR